MSEVDKPYKIRLESGEWYRGKDENGDPQWTRVPAWAYVFTEAAELAEVLEWLEESEHEYALLQAR